MPGQVKTITSLPSAAPLTGSEVVPLDQSGSTVKALVSAISGAAALAVNNVKSFGAAGDGTTNDTTAVQNAIDNLPSTGGVVFFPPGVYVINGTLSVIDKEQVVLRGSGAQHLAVYGSAPTKGTVLKRVSGVGTLLSVGASGSAPQSVSGVGVESLSIDGNNLAATGLLITSVYGGSFRDLNIRNCTTVALDVTTVNLVGVDDTQECVFERITVRQIESATGIGIRLGSGSAGIGNTSLNTFDDIVVFHHNGVGLQMNDTDTNRLIGVQTNRDGTGTAIGVELGASNHASSGHARFNTFLLLQSGAGGVTARATGFTQPARNNNIYGYSRGNSSALPTIEPNAILHVITDTGLIYPTVHGDHASGLFIKDDFVGGSTGSGTIGELGWPQSGGTTTAPTAIASHPGIIRMDTTAASGTIAFMRLGGASDTSAHTTDFFDITFLARLNVNDANVAIRFGISNNPNAAPPSSGIFIEKDFADTSWFGVGRSAGVQSRTTALASVTTNWVRVRIRRINTTDIGFSVDGGTELTVSTNVPSIGASVFWQITNNAAASKTADVDYFEMTVLLATAR